METPLELLYRAFNSPFGIVVQTDDPERLRTRLYPVRKEDPELECIAICVSPTAPNSELWLVKKGLPHAPEEP